MNDEITRQKLEDQWGRRRDLSGLPALSGKQALAEEGEGLAGRGQRKPEGDKDKGEKASHAGWSPMASCVKRMDRLGIGAFGALGQTREQGRLACSGRQARFVQTGPAWQGMPCPHAGLAGCPLALSPTGRGGAASRVHDCVDKFAPSGCVPALG